MGCFRRFEEVGKNDRRKLESAVELFNFDGVE